MDLFIWEVMLSIAAWRFKLVMSALLIYIYIYIYIYIMQLEDNSTTVRLSLSIYFGKEYNLRLFR